MEKLAVVILNFNGVQHLKTHLPQVLKNSTPYDVIVADNGSNDDENSDHNNGGIQKTKKPRKWSKAVQKHPKAIQSDSKTFQKLK